MAYVASRQVTWHAPLPPPSVLKAFRDAAPGSDQIILSEFQQQSEHRRSTETRESKAGTFALKVLSAGTVATNLAAIGCGTLLAALGHTWGAFIVVGGPLITVILKSASKPDDASS